MWVEAILSKDDLATVLTELCPLSIALGGGSDPAHYIKFMNPGNVSLVADRGLRLTCEAEICWPVLGVEVPVHVESLTLMLGLTLESALGEEALLFKPALEDIDLAWVPNHFEGKITERLNQQLSQKHIEFSWRFFQTLSHVFELPTLLRPVNALELSVAWGKVRLTEEALVLAVSYHTRIRRDGEPRLP